MACRLSRCEGSDVFEGYLGEEPAGEHAVVFDDKVVSDVDCVELKAWEFGFVAVFRCVELGPDEVDDFDRPSCWAAS